MPYLYIIYLYIIEQDIKKLLFGTKNGVERIKEHFLVLKSKVQLKTEEAILNSCKSTTKRLFQKLISFRKNALHRIKRI